MGWVTMCRDGQVRHIHGEAPVIKEEVGSTIEAMCTGEILRIRFSYLGPRTCDI